MYVLYTCFSTYIYVYLYICKHVVFIDEIYNANYAINKLKIPLF